MQVKLGFVDAANPQSLMDFKDVYTELVRRSRPSLVSAPPVSFLFDHACSFR
jgi:phosphatidylserine decarboxylase